MADLEKENKSYAYQKFRKLREERNLTEYRVSAETGISTTVLTQWSRGDYDLKLDKLVLIANFFEVPITEFIE